MRWLIFDIHDHTTYDNDGNENAYLCTFDFQKEWFPASECSIHDEETMIKVPIWLIKKKGLECYIEED